MLSHSELLQEIQAYLLFEPVDHTTLEMANNMLTEYFRSCNIECDVDCYFYDNQLNFSISFKHEKDAVWYKLTSS